MKRLTVLTLLLAFFTLGCTDRDDNLDAVNLRIKNVSEVTFNRIQVGADDKIHENIGPGEFSDYLEYEVAYRYAYIEITAEGETYTLQPIDFVGEQQLNLGFYTYELLPVEGGSVDLNFVAD